MMGADDYMFDDDYSSNIWEFFYYEKDARENIWALLRSESPSLDVILESLGRAWEVLNSHPDKRDSLPNYLEVLKNLGKGDDNLQVKRLVMILENKII